MQDLEPQFREKIENEFNNMKKEVQHLKALLRMKAIGQSENMSAMSSDDFETTKKIEILNKRLQMSVK